MYCLLTVSTYTDNCNDCSTLGLLVNASRWARLSRAARGEASGRVVAVTNIRPLHHFPLDVVEGDWGIIRLHTHVDDIFRTIFVHHVRETTQGLKAVCM